MPGVAELTTALLWVAVGRLRERRTA